MPEYKVTLTRSFVVAVQAENEETARTMTELYIGYGDDSKREDRRKFNFAITDIDMIENNAIEAEEVDEDA